MAWWCATCGRIEAPRQCVGICVREPQEMLRAALYDEALAQATVARHAERSLAGLASTVAHVKPREGQGERTREAMRSRARAVLDAVAEPQSGG